jgi:hypothetical protein
VSRYSAESLAGDADGPDDEAADADEPRVYEETEGTPTASRAGAPAVDADEEGSR